MTSTIGITGAAGRVGTVLRAGLREHYDQVRLLDIVAVDEPHDKEVCFTGDLSDTALVDEFMNGCDAVIHLAGLPDEAPFADILQHNILGTYTVYEAARKHGTNRVVFASTNHVVGFYERSEKVGTTMPQRPDSLYGASKAFGEDLARLYHDKWGMDMVCVRIGSFQERPRNARQLSTWLGFEDTVQLFHRAIEAPDIGFSVVFGVSGNSRSWWENTEEAAALGYVPQQSADSFIAELEDMPEEEVGSRHHGGFFVSPDYHGGRG